MMQNMKMTIVLTLVMIVLVSTGAMAQRTGGEEAEKFSFGPPLRSDYIFAYKYTERVGLHHSLEGRAFDSTERILTYFLTERQIIAPDGSGRVTVDVVVDSMMLSYTSSGERLDFHTQHLQGNDWEKVKHREVLVPSALVNRKVTFHLSPYGELLEMRSPALDNVRDQTAAPEVDDYTRLLAANMTTPAYLAGALETWRGITPIGEVVETNTPILGRKLFALLDRVSFKTKGTITLVSGEDGTTHLKFNAPLEKPLVDSLVWPQFEEPVPVVSASGSITGDLKLDEDGVVNTGWSVAEGTIVSRRGGSTLTTRVRHESYIELMTISPAVNDVSAN